MAKTGSFGIKEVADVWLLSIPTGTYVPSITAAVNGADVSIYYGGTLVTETGGDNLLSPEFIFDSLKVSNIEFASEETSARGGKGNPELISWSYGKTATLTLTDALISDKTMELMFGGTNDTTNKTITIDGSTFPKAYTMVGKTVRRKYDDGTDTPFLFVIPKAQLQVGGTLTMEAEGDPSTFEMTVKAMSSSVGTDNAHKDDVLVQFVAV